MADELALPAGPLAAVSTVARRSLTPTVIVDELHVGERVQRRVKVPLLRMAGEVADGENGYLFPPAPNDTGDDAGDDAAVDGEPAVAHGKYL